MSDDPMEHTDEPVADNVIALPGVTVFREADDIPSMVVLEAAIHANLNGVIVIGRLPCGCLYIDHADGNTELVLGRLTRALSQITNCESPHAYEHEAHEHR